MFLSPPLALQTVSPSSGVLSRAKRIRNRPIQRTLPTLVASLAVDAAVVVEEVVLVEVVPQLAVVVGLLGVLPSMAILVLLALVLPLLLETTLPLQLLPQSHRK